MRIEREIHAPARSLMASIPLCAQRSSEVIEKTTQFLEELTQSPEWGQYGACLSVADRLVEHMAKLNVPRLLHVLCK